MSFARTDGWRRRILRLIRSNRRNDDLGGERDHAPGSWRGKASSWRPLLGLFRDVWESLKGGPARAGLSFLAASIGIAALVMLWAVLAGLRQRARDLLQDLGGNVLVIQAPLAGASRTTQPLTRADRDTLAASFPRAKVSAVRRFEVAQADGVTISVLEADEALPAVRGWAVTQGRFFDADEVARGARVGVITEDLKSLWAVGLGSTVRVEGEFFTVVGIIGAGGRTSDAAKIGSDRSAAFRLGERTLVVPYSSRGPWESPTQLEQTWVDAVYVLLPRDISPDACIPTAAGLLAAGNRDISDWSWTTPQALIEGVQRIQRAVQLAGGSIAVLCLVLAGTTLMSLMVANVRERVAEIGLRRALGASARDIAVMFLVEAWIIMVMAAATGLTLGLAVLLAIRGPLSVPLGWGWGMVGWPVVVALLLGTVFTYWPVKLATAISPVEALRND